MGYYNAQEGGTTIPRRMTKAEWQKTQYSSTEVGVFQSQGTIMGLLREHLGVKKVGFVEFEAGGGGVIFEYKGQQYRFDAVPIEVTDGQESHKKRAERQVWRWLCYHVKDLIGASFFIPIDDLLLPHLLVAPGKGRGEDLTLGEALRRGRLELPPAREE